MADGRWGLGGRSLTARPYITVEAMAFGGHSIFGTRDGHGFRGQLDIGHMFACLRFADIVTAVVTRLATSTGGLTLHWAGLAPLDALRSLIDIYQIIQFFSTGMARSHRAGYAH